MENLLLHPRTAEHLASYMRSPTQALLLLGADGIGKRSVAQAIAAEILGVSSEKLPNHTGFRSIVPDDRNTTSISIESVRALHQFVQLKTTGKARLRRVILIEHADRMTTEAQNAFLKLLEEPPADTVILMTASHMAVLLPTIRSRTQQITITQPDKDALLAAYRSIHDEKQITTAYFLSDGLPGLMAALLQEDQSHPLATSVAIAKQLLQQTTFDRLLHVEVLAKQKESAVRLCEALARIAQAGLRLAAQKQDNKRIQRWHTILRESSEAQSRLASNGNAKLVLTHLFLHI